LDSAVNSFPSSIPFSEIVQDWVNCYFGSHVVNRVLPSSFVYRNEEHQSKTTKYSDVSIPSSPIASSSWNGYTMTKTGTECGGDFILFFIHSHVNAWLQTRFGHSDYDKRLPSPHCAITKSKKHRHKVLSWLLHCLILLSKFRTFLSRWVRCIRSMPIIIFTLTNCLPYHVIPPASHLF
jgi:hypothetical protein